MPRLLSLTTSTAAVLAALFCLSCPVQAKTQAACSVSVEYLLNNVPVESYFRDIVLIEGVSFEEDLSTPTRQKGFSATLNRLDGQASVSMTYFSDVSVFNTIDVTTSLPLVKGRTTSTNGRHVFSTSVGSPGNHLTRHTLRCDRL